MLALHFSTTVMFISLTEPSCYAKDGTYGIQLISRTYFMLLPRPFLKGLSTDMLENVDG